MNGFFAIGAAGIVGYLIGSPIAYWLMGHSHWTTAWTAVGAMVIVLACAIALPETLHFKGKPEPESVPAEAEEEESQASFGAVRRLFFDTVSSISHLMRHDTRLAILLVLTIFTTFGASSQEFLQQYIAKRYKTSWREANLIMSIKMLGKLLLIVLIMPVINEALIRAKIPTFRKDLWITRFSVSFAVLAYLGFAFSINLKMFIASLVILALNQPYDSSLKSVMVTLAGQQNTAMMFSVLAITASIGEFISAPLMAYCFRIGLKTGGAWIGLPFIVAGCLWGTAALILVGMSSHHEHDEQEQEEREEHAQEA